MPGMHHASSCAARTPRRRSAHPRTARATAGRRSGRIHRAGYPGLGAVPCAASLPGLRVPFHHLLAQDHVYFTGHPVAVVVATDRYVAQDAANWWRWTMNRCLP